MLDKFRETAITWDKANRKVYEPLRVSAGDNKGRKLTVQLVNDGVVEDLTGASLSLFWETRDKTNKGLDAFTSVDATKGEFEIYYTTGMLSNEGTLNANLVLVDTSGRVVSEPFTITVFKGIDDEAVQSSDSFTALAEALITVNQYNSRITNVENTKVDKSTFEQNKLSVDQQLQQKADKSQIGAPSQEQVDAWLVANPQATTTVQDRSVTPKKTTFIFEGKNKFDKAKAIYGKAIQWHDGTYADNASYFTSEKMEIPSPTTITISGHANITYVLRNKDGVYVRGLNTSTTPLTITTTENEKTLEISAGLSRKDLVQVELGSSATSYSPYALRIDSALLPESASGGGTTYGRVKIVSANGDGEYLTIQSAVNASVDGDTILVLPGTYNESLKMKTKDIAIVGLDKTKCILKSTSSDYYSPTVEAAKGTIRNMTIYCERPAGANWDGTSLLAYAMHIDFAESIGKKLLIEDCIIKSGWNSVLGIGMQNNAKLTLRNNLIIQYGDLNNVPTKGALYAHNTNNSNAEFIMDNNRIVVDVGNVMNIDEVYSASTGKTVCTFINNNLVSKEKGVSNVVLLDASVDGGFSGKTILKAVNSFGNNIPILNA